MNKKSYTLDDLFSDSGPFNEAEVAEAIHPFITIQKSTNEIFFKESCLTSEQRILIYGLAKKLLKFKSLLESEMITALEVHKKTGIRKGTIDPLFKKLKQNGFLIGKREYEVPVNKIKEIINLINNQDKR